MSISSSALVMTTAALVTALRHTMSRRSNWVNSRTSSNSGLSRKQRSKMVIMNGSL
ncbi:hypothetical protein [Bradyrhizobium sp. USDA 329]|uniref:hypothetical protein n=1 Tax=unclassified Bradyrhizobium TaxID=2631580 RepID=UPI0035194699